MNVSSMVLKRIAKLGVMLMVGASMSAGAGLFGFGGDRWKEEVLLHDGQKIIVERTVKLHGRHEIGQSPPIGEQSIRFAMPGSNQQVEWKDEFSKEFGSANFLLMTLDAVRDVAYLVVTPMGCLSYNKWGRPNPPYVIFKYQGNAWTRIPLQELPAEIKLPNMLHSSPDEVVEKNAKGGIVSAEIIRSENEGGRQPAYRSILRKSYSGAEAGCSEMIKVNDGWEGLGFFRLQGSYEACLKYCDRKDVDQQNCPCNKLFKGAK